MGWRNGGTSLNRMARKRREERDKARLQKEAAPRMSSVECERNANPPRGARAHRMRRRAVPRTKESCDRETSNHENWTTPMVNRLAKRTHGRARMAAPSYGTTGAHWKRHSHEFSPVMSLLHFVYTVIDVQFFFIKTSTHSHGRRAAAPPRRHVAAVVR